MDAYLKTTHTLLRTQAFVELNIVLGNESCDLDSAVCSLVYAAFLYWRHYQIKCRVCTKDRRDDTTCVDDVFVPVLNVDREDFNAKTEVAFCLREHGIDQSKLIFRNDFDIKTLTRHRRTSVTLVDHYDLSRHDEFYRPFVSEVIDHRHVDSALWNFNPDTRSTIELVGSCSTLVTHRIRDMSLLLRSQSFFDEYPVCAELLHCTIILDTVNFSKELDKARPRDVEAVDFLENVLKPKDWDAERKCKLEILTNARSDVSKLSAAQLVKKDLKIVGDILVPSFPILIREFLSRPGALKAIGEALERHSCNVALLLGMSLAGPLQRDTAIYATKHHARAAQLSKFIQEWKSPSLDLELQQTQDVMNFYYYLKQSNITVSRKQYMPCLNQFLNTFKI